MIFMMFSPYWSASPDTPGPAHLDPPLPGAAHAPTQRVGASPVTTAPRAPPTQCGPELSRTKYKYLFRNVLEIS